MSSTAEPDTLPQQVQAALIDAPPALGCSDVRIRTAGCGAFVEVSVAPTVMDGDLSTMDAMRAVKAQLLAVPQVQEVTLARADAAYGARCGGHAADAAGQRRRAVPRTEHAALAALRDAGP